MTINAKDILDRARRVLLDETNVRWPLPELRLWLNDALREIALLKPTAYSDSIIVPLAVGTLQHVPSNCAAIMRVIRNLKSSQSTPREGAGAVRVVDITMLDASSVNWHDDAKVKYRKTVKNVAFDAADPRAFYVYPGNDGTGIVEAIVSRLPVQIAAPASNVDSLTSYDASLDVQDIYANALVDYILFRAFSKDSQYSGSVQRAAAYYGLFANALGVTVQNDAARNPNTKPSPDQENAA